VLFVFLVHALFLSEVVAVLPTFDLDSWFILECHLLDLTLRLDKQTWIPREVFNLVRLADLSS
jgi:hypothetical protein